MYNFQKDLNKNLSLITSYRTWINDNGDIIEQHPSMKKLYDEDTLLNGKDFGNRMLMAGQNIIGEPTIVLFRKSLLTEPFGTLNSRKYGCSVDMASWIHLLSKGDAMYITEPLSSFRVHSGQQVRHKFLEGCEDFSQLVLTSKKYGFLQDPKHYKKGLIRAYGWYKNAFKYYNLFPNLIPDINTQARLSYCLNMITKELCAI